MAASLQDVSAALPRAPRSVRREPRPLGAIARAVLPSFGSLTLLLVVYVLFTNNYRFLQDSDTGWHIRTGDWIRQTGSIPRTDIFSFTVANQPWFAWEWLTDVAMSALHIYFGLAGVACAAWLVLLAAYALLFRTMQQRSADPIVSCALTVFAAVASIVHWLARPHVVSILLLVLWLVLVENHRRYRSRHTLRMIYGAPLLIALWANLHGAFAVTFALLVIYAAGEWLELAVTGRWREWRVIVPYVTTAALSAVAALFTPYGFALYGHLIRYLGDKQLLALIDEFKSPDFHSVDGKLIEILLVLAIAAAVRAARQCRFVEVGLVALWSHMTLQSERHVTLAVIVLTPIIAEQGTEALRSLIARWDKFDRVRRWYGGIRRLDRQLNGAFVAVLVFIVLTGLLTQPAGAGIFGNSFSAKRFPVEAATFIESQLVAGKLSGKVFAADQFGGYLIYRFAPRVKVFVDGRSDLYRQSTVFPVLEDMNRLAQVRSDWAAILARYEIEWMLLQRDEPLSLMAQQSGAWQVAHSDATAQILIRRER
jgi:hypothetical protein